jgi:hypothetical protein
LSLGKIPGDKDKALEILDKSHYLIRDLLNIGDPNKDKELIEKLIRNEFQDVYRDYRNPLMDIIDERFSKLRYQVDRYYSYPNYDNERKLSEDGLTKSELGFKYKIFNITYNKVYQIDEEIKSKKLNDDEFQKQKEYKSIWDKLKDVIAYVPHKILDFIDDIKDSLGAINTILKSLGMAGLPSEAIEEAKQFIERILRRQKDIKDQNDQKDK